MTQPSLQARIGERLDRAPERRALAFYGPDGRFEWMRFGDLVRRAQSLGRVLASHGLERGEVCIVVLPSGETAVVTTLAVLLMGAVPLLTAPPIVAGSQLDLPRILGNTARRSRAKLVVCAETMRGMRDELESESSGTTYVFGLKDPGPGTDASPTLVLPASDDVAAMQLTSGTTGFPRICVWEQRSVLAALDGMAPAMDLSEHDVCFNWTPLYHDMGLVNNFLLCLTRGIPLVLLPPEEFVRRPSLWLRGLSDTESTITWSPNFGFALATLRVKERELEGVRLDAVRGMWNAAERIHLGTLLEFRERYATFGLRPEAVKTNFGCAENVGGATFSDPAGEIVFERVDGDRLHEDRIATPLENASDPRTAAIVGVGRPHPALAIEILSEEGRPLPDGRVGEIALRTPSRMRGYLDDEEASERALLGDLLRTGDLGYRRGEELFWVGRSLERITVRGKKFDPSDFEPILFGVEGLREGCFVAFGVDEEKQGTQRIVVVSEVREPLARPAADIVSEILRETVLRLGVTISEVLLVRPGSLAKTSSGKRRHRHFRREYQRDGLKAQRVQQETRST